MLKHVSFITHAPEAVSAFYVRLGGRLTKDVVSPDGLRRIVVTFEGGGKLQFFAASEPMNVNPSWMEHVALELTDLHGSLSELRDAGVPFTRELHLSPGGNPVAFVTDPDGRQVELLQRGL